VFRHAADLLVKVQHLSFVLVIVCVALPCRESAAQQGFDVPEDIYLRFDEGAGSTVENLAIPGIGSRILSTVPGWVTPGSPSGSACRPDPTNPLNVISANQPFSLFGSWTIEFTAFFDPNLNVTGGSLCGDPSAGLTFSVVPPTFFFGLTINVVLVDISGISITTGVTMFSTGWHHIAFVFDATTATFLAYLDGSLWTSFSTGQSLTFAGTNPLGFCIGGDGVTAPTDMPFDEFRFWRRARSAAEIAANSTTTLIDPTAREIRFGPNGLTSVFNPANGSFTASGTVSELILRGGESFTTAIDPIIGATVSMSGSYTGSDLATFSDVLLTVSNLQIAALGGNPALTFQGFFAASAGPAPYFELGGPLGALPLRRRILGSPFAPNVTRTGSGSVIMDNVDNAIATGAASSMILRDDGQGLRIAALGIDFQPPPPTATVNVATDGSGAFLIGAVGLPAGSYLANLFAVSPGNPVVGQGPLFGIVFGPDQFAQLSLPIGIAPFKVLPDIDGNYLFGVPPGTIAPGLVVDHVGIVVQSTLTVASPAKRLIF
jgi:hypothetical protein